MTSYLLGRILWPSSQGWTRTNIRRFKVFSPTLDDPRMSAAILSWAANPTRKLINTNGEICIVIVAPDAVPLRVVRNWLSSSSRVLRSRTLLTMPYKSISCNRLDYTPYFKALQLRVERSLNGSEPFVLPLHYRRKHKWRPVVTLHKKYAYETHSRTS